jgi:UDP-2-acetamido-2,6-beta-L-arabino-hexul-4-ose reductase
MISIGITGQNGFVGSHLYNTLSLSKSEFKLIDFQSSWFQDQQRLCDWVSNCDVIVHLAGMNRHPDPHVIYETNVSLVSQLISACDFTKTAPHILFSSSTQEELDNFYGKSKKRGRELLVQWAERSGASVTGLIIPNVFGPFGKPFYNSVVATFCHQLCNGGMPEINVDNTVRLIYVAELVDDIIRVVRTQLNDPAYFIHPTAELSVSDLLNKLMRFKREYFEQGVIPALASSFEKNLFNTYRSYINLSDYFPFLLKKNTDDRGMFVETVKLNQGGQISFSTTVKGITRGNHFHTRKIERFAVIKGKALIQLRKYNTTDVFDFILDGQDPSYVDMPVWYTHNIKNIGEEDLYTIFWINEFYNAADPDTFFETV